jgi:hypothetical protein
LEECNEESRQNSLYCSNEHRLSNARRLYEERNPGRTRLVEHGMTAEQFGEEASKFLDQHAPLPPVPANVLATKREDMGFDTPQHAVACFSDYHFGGVVDPRVTGGIGGYDIATARRRLTLWRDRVLRFTQMIQLTTDVPVLHILALGDDMEGNGHMFPTQALQMEESAYFQYLGFVEDISSILTTFLARFEEIHVYKVFGNHGRLAGRAKENFDPDNFELMAWQTIKERVEKVAPGRFTFDISPSFYQLVDILGFEFYLRHGDGVNLRSTYTGALDTKLATNSIVGKVIPYMVIAHHHTATNDEAEIGGEIISNGCFVGPSLLALRMRRPRANRPSQELFFVHPKRGITHRHRIHLADVDEVRQVEVVKRT